MGQGVWGGGGKLSDTSISRLGCRGQVVMLMGSLPLITSLHLELNIAAFPAKNLCLE